MSEFKQVEMPADNFEKLKMTVEWYDNMPAYLEVGDRFHEMLAEEMDDFLPEIEEITSDEFYSDGLEMVEGKLIWNLLLSDDDETELKIELIPA